MEKLLDLILKVGPSLVPGGGAADTVLGYAMKYGPALVEDVVEALKKKNLTIADVEAIFADVKPYSAFGIKDPNAAAAAAPSPATLAATNANPLAPS
jgi:hypothetical protein